MPEVRLGSSASMKNINLGAKELQEVYLGAVLVWRNNVPPFYTVSINGVVVTTNGTILAPVKPPKKDFVPTQDFEYTSDIPVLISSIEEEDQPLGDIVFNLYEGDYTLDKTLPVVDTFTTTVGVDGTLTIPKGPQPTGATAADFVYDGRLFTITATDIEGAVSIQFLKITRIDSEDYKVYGSFSNSGGQYNARTRTSTQRNLTRVSNNQCYSENQTVTTFNRVTSTPVASQNQTRTCTVQIVGVEDNPPKVCSGGDFSRVVTVTTGTATSTDVTVSVDQSPNPNFTSAYDVAVPENEEQTQSISVGPCLNIGDGSGCGQCNFTCPGTGTEVVTTTTTIINRNCANIQISTSDGGSVSTDRTCTGTYNNPDAPTEGRFSSGFGSLTPGNFDVQPPAILQEGSLNFTFNATRQGVCKAGYTMSRCEAGNSNGAVSSYISSGGVGSQSCVIVMYGTITPSSYGFCSTSSGAVYFGYAGKLVATSTALMECT